MKFVASFFLFWYFVFWIVLCIVNLTLKFISLEWVSEWKPWVGTMCSLSALKCREILQQNWPPLESDSSHYQHKFPFDSLSDWFFAISLRVKSTRFSFMQLHWKSLLAIEDESDFDLPLKCFQVAIEDEAWLNHSRNFYWISFWKKNVMSRNAKFSYLLLSSFECLLVKLYNVKVAIKTYCHDTCTYVREEWDIYWSLKWLWQNISLLLQNSLQKNHTLFSLMMSTFFRWDLPQLLKCFLKLCEREIKKKKKKMKGSKNQFKILIPA